MATEIERKFLLASDDWRLEVADSRVMVQGYLFSDPAVSVRVRIAGDSAWLNIKSGTVGIRRLEYEYDVPLEDAEQILDSLCKPPVIRKTRHLVPVGEYVFEIDEFAAENAGLVVAEVELESEGADFPSPTWLGKEVSEDARYLNSNLAKAPFTTWPRS